MRKTPPGPLSGAGTSGFSGSGQGPPTRCSFGEFLACHEGLIQADRYEPRGSAGAERATKSMSALITVPTIA